MAEIVNLNRARKRKRAAEKEKAAEANRVKFGRTKAEKDAVRAESERADRALDGARRDEDI